MIHAHHELLSPDLMGGITLAAAFLGGIASSTHCLVMCGGVSGALGMRARAIGVSAKRAFLHGLTYQVGRLSSYTLAGALCGAFGQALKSMVDLVQLGIVMRVFAGALLIVLALQFMMGWRLLQGLERAGAMLWRRLAPIIPMRRSTSIASSLLLGALWGWMPCGLVYSMLLFATFAGTAAHGAAVMALFGMGTLPAMLSSTLLASQLQRLARRPGFSRATGALLLCFGLVTAIAPLVGRHH